MSLYGHELGDDITTLEANLGWITKLQKGDFVGRDKIAELKENGLKRKLVGFEMKEPGIARDGYDIYVGEDKVGIGTDFTQGYSTEFFDWITHDKGRYRRLTNFGKVVNPEGIRTIGEFPNLTHAMERAGWSETRILKIMGENWVRVFRDVWGA